MNVLAPILDSEASSIRQERDQRVIESLDSVCQRVGRVLTASSVKVRSVRGPQVAPAWISGRNITFAYDEITKMTNGEAEDRAMVTNCLLFHELGHYRFDPKLDNAIWRKREQVARLAGGFNKGLHHMALNVLTDQRHELLTATVYPKARDYFAVSTTRGMSMVVKKYGGVPAENYLLYYGRRHILPSRLIAGLRARFVAATNEATTVKAEALINEFVTLTLSDEDVARMWDVALEFATLLPKQPQQDDCLSNGVTGTGSSKVLVKKAADAAKKQQDKQDEADKADKPAPQAVDEEADAGALAGEGDEADAGEGDEDEGDEGFIEVEDEGDDALDASEGEGDDAEGEDEGDEDDALDDAHAGFEASGGTSGDDAEDKAEAKADADDDGGAGAGGESNDAPLTFTDEEEQEMRDLIEKARVEAGDAVAQDLLPYIEAMRRALTDEGIKGDALSKSVAEEAKRLTRMFEKVNVDLGLVEMRGQRSGRLDVRRAVGALIRQDTTGRVFRKRGDDLTDDAAMGVFIAIDASSSMGHHSVALAQDAALSLANGAEGAGHMAKIIAFGNNPYEVVKGWFSHRYSQRRIQSEGSTPFVPFLSRLAPELAALYDSEKIRHSAVFICTDGGHDEAEGQVREAMRKVKAERSTHIFVIGIGTTPNHYNEVDAVVRINNVNELSVVMKRLLGDLSLSIARDLSEGR